MDQGILRFTWYSLILVAQGYALALVVGTPIGFCPRAVEDLHEDFRPDHPDSPPGLAARVAATRPRALHERGQGRRHLRRTLHHRHLRDVADRASTPRSACARCRRISSTSAKSSSSRAGRRSRRSSFPATLPYMFTGFRLSLGIAWLAIVAARDAHRPPRRGRLPLAGIQRAHLRAHHSLDHHHRPRRFRPRSSDGRSSNVASKAPKPCPSSNSPTFPRASAAPPCSATST